MRHPRPDRSPAMSDALPGVPVDGVRAGVAELRFRRLVAFALGLTMFFYLVVDFPALQAQADYYPAWWIIPIFAGRILAILALTVGTWFADERQLRVLSLSIIVFGLVAIATMIPSVGIGGMPEALGAPWILRVRTSFMVVAALALTPARAWAFLVLFSALAGVARWFLLASGDVVLALEDTVVTISVAALLVVFVQHIVLSGRTLDRAAVDAASAARRDAADAALAAERRHVELAAHDDILYTLRAAALGLISDTSTPQSLARETLRRLDELQEPDADEAEAPLPSAEFLRRLRALATDLAPNAEFEAAGDLETTVPAAVAVAVLEASGEALRNSVAHAGSDPFAVRRRVVVRSSDSALSVTISDDGRGFRTRRVPPHRLGVSRSILERVRSVPGGNASVTSAPGAGTTVALGWRR